MVVGRHGAASAIERDPPARRKERRYRQGQRKDKGVPVAAVRLPGHADKRVAGQERSEHRQPHRPAG